MGFIRKLILKFLRFSGLYIVFFFLINKVFSLNVLTVKETFGLIKKGKTVIRFGDGELRLLMGVGEAGFQRRDSKLEVELNEIFHSYISGQEREILLCMPGALSSLSREYVMTREVFFWWFTFSVKYFKELRCLFSLCRGVSFGEAYITRPYYAVQDLEFARYVFEEFKNLFRGKRLLILEGRFTRFGVGNDLLDGAKSVRRILGPEVDAYEKVGEIYERSKLEDCDIVLIALGPAAKILAYRLNKVGYCCLDVGHLDIEYEWYKARAKEKVSILNKYVNESKEKFVMKGALDEDYEREVVYRCE